MGAEEKETCWLKIVNNKKLQVLKTNNLLHQLVLHVLSGLNKGPTNNDKTNEQIGVDSALLFFKALTCFELVATL